MEGEQSFRLCRVHWHVLETSSVCCRTSSTYCYTEQVVASSTADTVINYYTEHIVASSTADTVRNCYTEHMVGQDLPNRLSCFQIDALHRNYRKLSVGVFSFISDICLYLYLFTYCLVKKETRFPLCL